MNKEIARGGWRWLATTALVVVLAGCTTTRENMGSDFTGTLEDSGGQPRTGPCGERYTADVGMELSMIRQLLDEERPRSALAYLESGDYGVPEARLMQADALRDIGRLEESDARYGELVDGCLVADAYRGLAHNAFAREAPDEALRYMRQARHERPVDERIRNDLGYLLMLRGEYDEAIEEFLTALELDDGMRLAAGNLVLALLRDDQWDRAGAKARRFGMDDQTLAAMQAAVAGGSAPSTGGARPLDDLPLERSDSPAPQGRGDDDRERQS
jgi:Flp pilus assembly protein TadD